MLCVTYISWQDLRQGCWDSLKRMNWKCRAPLQHVTLQTNLLNLFAHLASYWHCLDSNISYYSLVILEIICVASEWCCHWSFSVWHRNKLYSRTKKLYEKNKKKVLSANSNVLLWVPDGAILRRLWWQNCRALIANNLNINILIAMKTLAWY